MRRSSHRVADPAAVNGRLGGPALNIVLQYRASRGFLAQIDEVFGAGAVEVIDETDDVAFARSMAKADALLHVLEPVTAQVIAGSPRLGLIQKLGVGVNTIDLDAARAAGAAVCNMPGVNSIAVAEMALALMLAVLRRLRYLDTATRAGEGWRPDLDVLDTTGEIAGRTVGLLGFGGSARRLAAALEALGARVVYHARTAKPDVPYAFLSLEDLLGQADVLSIHMPVEASTRGLIGEAAFARMKPGAVLINTARGELVDEAALARALSRGRLRGAGLDVFAGEPIGADHPLLAFPQVVASPHAAWLTPETLRRSLVAAKENCRRLAAGEPLLNRVA
ncbi:MAG TPA: NAD(P)-dependent oxidoreductase [Caulobacteraceae bacterium]|nr:NAD(P)-dependent oxidoreductase [Caulobacteraceae bacterium]